MEDSVKPLIYLVDAGINTPRLHFVADCPSCGVLPRGSISSPTSSKERISEEQQSRLKRNSYDPASQHLLYINHSLVGLTLSLNGGTMNATCPKCKREYTITQEDFNDVCRSYSKQQKTL